MPNFLMEHEEIGFFFVQCTDETKIADILIANEIEPDECVLLDVYSDAEAEILGYDTF